MLKNKSLNKSKDKIMNTSKISFKKKTNLIKLQNELRKKDAYI